LADVDFARVLWVGGGGEHIVDGVHRTRVDGGGMPVEAQVAFGGRETDEDRAVDVRGEQPRTGRH
jgi:hypothetical protein